MDYNGNDDLKIVLIVKIGDGDVFTAYNGQYEWYDQLEFTFMMKLDIWYKVDRCKNAGDDEVRAGVDCPWDVWWRTHNVEAGPDEFKGVAKRNIKNSSNPLEFGKEYSIQSSFFI